MPLRINNSFVVPVAPPKIQIHPMPVQKKVATTPDLKVTYNNQPDTASHTSSSLNLIGYGAIAGVHLMTDPILMQHGGEMINDAGEMTMTQGGAAAGEIGEFAGAAAGEIGEFAGTAAGEIGEFAGTAAGEIGEFSGDAVGFVGNAAGAISNFDITDGVIGAIGTVGEAAGEVIGSVEGVLQSVGSLMSGVFQ